MCTVFLNAAIFKRRHSVSRLTLNTLAVGRIGAFTCLLFLAVSLSSYQAHSQQIITVSGDDLTIDLGQIGWSNSKAFTVARSTEKTPDNQDALKVEVFPSGKQININGKMPPDFEKTVSSLDIQWEEISFWVKSDDSGESVTLVFSTVASDWKPSLYTQNLKLIGTDWKKVEVKGLYNKEKKKLDFKFLKNIYMYATPAKKACFYISPINFTVKGASNLEPIKTIDVFQTVHPPKIDGILDDECWRKSATIDKFNVALASPASVKMCYDNDYIYVGFSQKINTSLLKKEQTRSDGTVWTDDSLQLFLSPGDDNRTYHQFIVNALNTQQTYHVYFDQVEDGFVNSRNMFAGKWESAVAVKDNEWAVELRIPRNLVPELMGKKIHGLQVYICNPSLNQNSFWTETDRVTKVVNFGILNLAGPQDAVLPKVGLKTANLRFKGNEPSLMVSLDSAKNYAIDAQISTPDGKTASIADTVNGSNTLVFKGYMPKGGVQRLVLSLHEGNGPAKVYAYRTSNISFYQQTVYGSEILLPQPKKMLKNGKLFLLTGREKIFFGADSGGENRLAAEKVQADLSGFMQIQLPVEQAAQLKPNCIVVGEKTDSMPVPASRKDVVKDGYVLEIGESGIVLAGDSPSGLFYAAVTLSQIERYAFLKNESLLKCSLIEDWPDLPTRIWNSWSDKKNSTHTANTKGVDTPQETLAVHYDYLNRLAIGTKMNFFSLQNPTSIHYENEEANAFSHRNAYMTIKELGELADYCRKNYVEFAPALHGPEHAGWMTGKYKELAMTEYESDADPTNPKFFEQLFLMYKELISASQPKYFNIWSDEWWRRPIGPVSTTYNGKEKRDIHLETILKIHAFFQERNIRMMMFSDMLQREHNGGKPYDIYLNAEKLPKDIVICTWGLGGATAVKYFAELGHTSWFIGNLCAQIESEKLRGVKNFTGLGVINYDSVTPDFGYGSAGMIRTADLAWNFWTDSGVSLEDWFYQNGPNIMPLYSVRPNPKASSEFVPLDISALCNDSYSKAAAGWSIAGLPQGKSNMGFIPALINPDKSKNIVRGEEKPAVIPVDFKASSLIFLHTQYCPPAKIKDFITKSGPRKTGSYHGLKTGTYLVNYTDGQAIPVYIRNVINCGNWQPFKGRVSSLVDNKYLIDARYVWEGPKVDGQETCLYQYEWVNPRPDVQIKNIEFSSMSTDAIPYLFALTVRKTKDTGDKK